MEGDFAFLADFGDLVAEVGGGVGTATGAATGTTTGTATGTMATGAAVCKARGPCLDSD